MPNTNRIRALNVGCGNDYRESTDEIGWVNLDQGNCRVDVCSDIENMGIGFKMFINNDNSDLFEVGTCPKSSIGENWYARFKENTFDRIDAIQVLEHISRENFPNVVRELYRISKDGAVWNVAVPHGFSDNMITDFTHKLPFSTRTFDYFVDGTQLRENGIIYGLEDIHLRHIEPPRIDGNQSIIFTMRVVKTNTPKE